jgi:hypothetical protein
LDEVIDSAIEKLKEARRRGIHVVLRTCIRDAEEVDAKLSYVQFLLATVDLHAQE